MAGWRLSRAERPRQLKDEDIVKLKEDLRVSQHLTVYYTISLR